MRHRVHLITLGAAVGCLGACTGGAGPGAAGAERELRPEDFAGGAPAAPPEHATGDPLSSPQSAPAFRVVTEEEAALIGAADVGAPIYDESAAAGETILVDAFIGDINGRPIFVSEVLADVGPRLKTEAANLSRAEWTAFARREIRLFLDGLLQDELTYAEAIGSLKPEQRAGLRTFMEVLRGELMAENRQSRTRAAQRLGERGLTEEEYLEQQKRAALIQNFLKVQVSDRVFVSWTDVLIAFERRQDQINEPGTAAFRVISAPVDTEAVRQISEALATGRPFEEVADLEANTSRLDSAGLRTATFQGNFQEFEFFGLPALNEAVHQLKPGEATPEPVRVGDNLYWIKVESVEQEFRSLRDVQLQIANDLMEERIKEEYERYLNKLKARASFTSVDEMTSQLLAIAAARYLPPEN